MALEKSGSMDKPRKLRPPHDFRKIVTSGDPRENSVSRLWGLDSREVGQWGLSQKLGC
jgi:hypothetical protein